MSWTIELPLLLYLSIMNLIQHSLGHNLVILKHSPQLRTRFGSFPLFSARQQLRYQCVITWLTGCVIASWSLSSFGIIVNCLNITMCPMKTDRAIKKLVIRLRFILVLLGWAQVTGHVDCDTPVAGLDVAEGHYHMPVKQLYSPSEALVEYAIELLQISPDPTSHCKKPPHNQLMEYSMVIPNSRLCDS